MGLQVILFFLFPAVVFGAMNINMMFSKYQFLTRVNYSGGDSSIITQPEREAFLLTDSDLIDICWKYYGVYPVEAVVNEPYLYRRYGEDKVERQSEISKAYIEDIESYPVTLATKEIVNNGSTEDYFDTNLTKEVSYKLKIDFVNADNITIRSPIRYDLRFIGPNFRVSYLGRWNENIVKKWHKVLGSSSYRPKVKLQPNETVEVSLTAMHHVAYLQAEVETELDGDMLCHFEPPYKGKNIVALSVKDGLEESNMMTKMNSYITLKVTYFTALKPVVQKL